MSGLAEGQSHANREIGNAMYLQTGDPGMNGGNQISTYTGTNTQPTLEQYENIFGPAARDIKLDQQRHKRHQRWHLPDALKGSNQYLTDRVDGLITDSTNSPFTRNILPYVYLENPDQKLKWNVYSFDEGIASRVPYESAARVLPQSKRSFAGYTVRQGLAIAMEHNFMVSQAGRENFRNQLTQLVGSIQMTNDLDVHVALLTAPSYQKHMDEKYYDNQKTTAQVCRQYVDLFGIINKIPNALDILIEDAKNHLKTWGSQPPTFMLCNGALTAQMTMIPEKTNYLTNGPDGLKRLADGPDLSSYRGLSIIPTRKFSMDAGTAPRDLLRRRVRVAEYYRIPWSEDNPQRTFEFYDQSRDTMFRLSWQQLMAMADLGGGDDADDDDMGGQHHQWAFSKVGRNIVYRGSTLSESVTDAVTITGDNNGDSLTLPAVHCVNGRRERKKRKRADVQGRQLTSRRNPGALQKSNMSVADAMNSISNPTYHESSETFGGGIFNDPLAVDENFNDNFKGIKDPSLEIGRNFLNWCAVRSFQLLYGSADTRTSEIESTIASGMGDYIYGPLWFAEDRWKCRREMVFRLLFYRYAEKKPDAERFVYRGRPIDLTMALTLTSEELANVWRANNALHGNFTAFVGEANTLSALTTYFGTTIEMLEMQLDLQGALGLIGNHFIENFTAVDDYNDAKQIRDRAFSYAKQILASYWPGAMFRDPPAAGGAINDNFDQIVLTPAVKAMFDYGDLITTWSGDIWLEKAYDNFIKPDNVTRFMNDVQGKQAHTCFAEMRTSIIQDILNKYLNYHYVSDYNDTNFVREHGRLEVVPDYVRGLKDAVANDVSVWHASNMTIYKTFLYDFKYHQEAGVIASNISNSDIFDEVFRPNLHITRCDPLTAADMEKSASSMNESTWLIQQLAGTMPLSVDMCDVLMSQANPPADRNTKREYSRFLTGPGVPAGVGGGMVNHHPEDPFNTLLMHWFMSRFHPIRATRELAASHCILEDACKNYLTQAMGNLLRNNQTFSSEVENAFKEIKPEAYGENASFYCPGVAASSYCNFPSYVSNFDTESTAVGAKIPWQNVPVFDKEAIKPTKYTSNPANNTVLLSEADMRLTVKTPMNNGISGTVRSYTERFGNLPVESDANKEIYNPLSGSYDVAANNTPLHIKLPWTYYLTSVMDTVEDIQPVDNANNRIGGRRPALGNMHRTPAVSGLTCNTFLMDANASMIDADALKQPICSNEIAYMRNDAAALCSDPGATDMVLDHVLLVLMNRFFKPTARFMNNGAGLPVINYVPQVTISNPDPSVALNVPVVPPAAPAAGNTNVYVVQGNGCHFSHGPRLPTVGGGGAGGGMNATDIVILRPNIEHEMLGVIMGRGGTQELGATFWGQTELSCYDDSQHGIWGMSYKYHERAMVTNERNLVRVFDVAFDGYNGGMDQKYVKWGDPSSRHEFQQATYERGRAYNGPSMLVMKFPTSASHSNTPWPNPIVFQPNMSGNATPDPEKGPAPSDLRNHMVFDASTGNCSVDQEQVYKQYMRVLGMEHWSTVDQSNKPAGDCCISNESASNMLAFQGTMKTYQGAALVDNIQGSGHLGPSFVGVASVREGRGLMPAVGQPALGHLM